MPDLENKLRRTSYVASALLAMLLCGPATSQDQRTVLLKQDRMATIESFLDEVYPVLRQENGLLTFQNLEFNNRRSEIRFHFIECRPGGGVLGPHNSGSYTPCDYLLESVKTISPGILDGYAIFAPNKFSIPTISVSGNLLHRDLDNFKLEVASHPRWLHADIVEALDHAHALYTADHRDAFVKTIPAKTITTYTGCRLNLQKATLAIGRFISPPDPPTIHVAWTVLGTWIGARSHTCIAEFDPFNANLISVQ